MRNIAIKIPEKKDLIRWSKILRFKLTGGFSCTKCGAKSNFNRVQFNSEVGPKRLILSNNTQGVCADCTQKELNDKADIVFTEDNCTCDWCEESKSTTSFPRHEDLESKVIFGGNYWNGHHICQDCLNMGFANRGPIHSNVIKYEKDNEYQRNDLGLWIKVT